MADPTMQKISREMLDKAADCLEKQEAEIARLRTALRESELRGLSASEVSCYLWPEDTAEHKALRAAYILGAAECGGKAD